MKRVLFVVLLAVALAAGLALGIAVSDTGAAQAEGPQLASQMSEAAAACVSVPLTISFCAPYGTANVPYNRPTLRVTDNASGVVVYNAQIPNGVTSVTIPSVPSGRSYNIRIGFVQPPGTASATMEPYALYYWFNGWDGMTGGQRLEAWIPGINQYLTIPCQSYGFPRPIYVTVKPPTGVIAGYLGVWANGTSPGYNPNPNGPLGPRFEWAKLPRATASGVEVQLWRPPTAATPAGTYIGSVVTNTEGYFLFPKVDPCQIYELKFPWDGATRVTGPIVATYQGQLYQVNAPNAGIFVPGGAFLR